MPDPLVAEPASHALAGLVQQSQHQRNPNNGVHNGQGLARRCPRRDIAIAENHIQSAMFN